MFAGVGIPQKSASVITCRCEQSPVRTEIHRVDVSGMPGQRAQLAPPRHVPNLYRVITAARSQEATITTESHLGNALPMTLERSNLPATRDVPKQYLPDRFDLHIFHELIWIGWLFGIFLLASSSHRRARQHLIQICL